MEFIKGDIVWTKIRGVPYWPCRIIQVTPRGEFLVNRLDEKIARVCKYGDVAKFIDGTEKQAPKRGRIAWESAREIGLHLIACEKLYNRDPTRANNVVKASGVQGKPSMDSHTNEMAFSTPINQAPEESDSLINETEFSTPMTQAPDESNEQNHENVDDNGSDQKENNSPPQIHDQKRGSSGFVFPSSGPVVKSSGALSKFGDRTVKKDETRANTSISQKLADSFKQTHDQADHHQHEHAGERSPPQILAQVTFQFRALNEGNSISTNFYEPNANQNQKRTKETLGGDDIVIDKDVENCLNEEEDGNPIPDQCTTPLMRQPPNFQQEVSDVRKASDVPTDVARKYSALRERMTRSKKSNEDVIIQKKSANASCAEDFVSTYQVPKFEKSQAGIQRRTLVGYGQTGNKKPKGDLEVVVGSSASEKADDPERRTQRKTIKGLSSYKGVAFIRSVHENRPSQKTNPAKAVLAVVESTELAETVVPPKKRQKKMTLSGIIKASRENIVKKQNEKSQPNPQPPQNLSQVQIKKTPSRPRENSLRHRAKEAGYCWPCSEENCHVNKTLKESGFKHAGSYKNHLIDAHEYVPDDRPLLNRMARSVKKTRRGN